MIQCVHVHFSSVYRIWQVMVHNGITRGELADVIKHAATRLGYYATFYDFRHGNMRVDRLRGAYASVALFSERKSR